MYKYMYLSDGIVCLRPVETADAEFLWKLDLEPRQWNENRFGPKTPYLKDIEKGKYWSDKRKSFIVELRQNGETIPVGKTGFRIGDITIEFEIGTCITSRYRNRGIGTRSKKLLIDYLFKAYPLSRVFASTHVDNAPSIRSIEKCGFTREGVARNIRFIRGKYCDFAGYSLLRTEYEEARMSWQLSGNTTPIEPREIDASEEPQYVLKGKSIQLRPVESEHMPFMAEVFSFAYPYGTEDIISVDEMKKEQETEDVLWGNLNRVFLIETHDGTPIGKVALWDYDKNNRFVEIGTLIIPTDGRGKGYGTEAKLLAMEYAFDIWPIERIYAGTNQYNRAARCSLSRAGLRYCAGTSGVQLGSRVPAGAAFYSVTRDQWMNQRTVCDA